MSSVSFQEILKLSVTKRIQLVEDIWDSIAASPESLPIPPNQRQELDRRLVEYLADPTAGRSWEEIRDSLDEKE